MTIMKKYCDMIRIYGMSTCPDCTRIKDEAVGNSRYEIIDIGTHAKYLKEFLRLRDSNPAFDPVKEKGYIGIPCFLLEDGTVTFSAEEAGLTSPCKYDGQENDPVSGASCSIDGKGC